MNPYPFLFGSQYYRAPTPEPECWEQDFSRMQELGFNAIKLFVQWRWSHRTPESFYFDDLDALMDLAQRNGLAVTLNTLTDMSPLWLFEARPDAKQITATGHVIEPYTVSHRSIGGHPGPCYSHPGALEDRRRFMAATVEHFRGQPALSAWDVWNEPEQSFTSRNPDFRTLTCYCPHCKTGFIQWLQAKYGNLDRLNGVWGRCYGSWQQVELPYTGGALTDFVDWREFHLDVMTEEARWRLDMTRELDPDHPVYLHVVPNTMRVFSSVTCVDDFALARHCDLFAASSNASPVVTSQLISAGQGRVCYNVESHVNFGSIGMHQRMLDLPTLLSDWLPQIGLGVKGFLFWQYRPEVLGAEAPAWGVVGLDGSDRPVTRAVQAFGKALGPHMEALRQAFPERARVGIWKSRRNELFHFAANGSLDSLADSVEGYAEALYWLSVPFSFVSDDMLAADDLGFIQMLIMPSCYYLTEPEAEALDRWVRKGGIVLCDAHLGGYNGTTGRHSRVLPGCGLAEAWGIRELDSTSSYHLRLTDPQAFSGQLSDDVLKALSTTGLAGGRFFPLRREAGEVLWGANRYAVIEGGVDTWATLDGQTPCIVHQTVRGGHVVYCGTNLGEGARHDPAPLINLLWDIILDADIEPTMLATAQNRGTVHVDLLSGPEGPAFIVITNRHTEAQTVSLVGSGKWRAVFGEEAFTLPGEVTIAAGAVELYALEGK